MWIEVIRGAKVASRLLLKIEGVNVSNPQAFRCTDYGQFTSGQMEASLRSEKSISGRAWDEEVSKVRQGRITERKTSASEPTGGFLEPLLKSEPLAPRETAVDLTGLNLMCIAWRGQLGSKHADYAFVGRRAPGPTHQKSESRFDPKKHSAVLAYERALGIIEAAPT